MVWLFSSTMNIVFVLFYYIKQHISFYLFIERKLLIFSKDERLYGGQKWSKTRLKMEKEVDKKEKYMDKNGVKKREKNGTKME